MHAYTVPPATSEKFQELWIKNLPRAAAPQDPTQTILRLLLHAVSTDAGEVCDRWRFTVVDGTVTDVEWLRDIYLPAVASDDTSPPTRPDDIMIGISTYNQLCDIHMKLWTRLPVPDEAAFRRLAFEAAPLGDDGLRADDRYLFWMKGRSLRRMRRVPKLDDRLLARCKKRYALDRYEVLEIACRAAILGRKLWLQESRALGVSAPRVFADDTHVVAMDLEDNVLAVLLRRDCGARTDSDDQKAAL